MPASIRASLLTSHLAIVIALTLLLGGLAYYLTTRHEKASLGEHVDLIARVMAEEIHHRLVAHEEFLEHIGEGEVFERVIKGRQNSVAHDLETFSLRFPLLIHLDRQGREILRLVNGIRTEAGDKVAGNLAEGSLFQAARKSLGRVVYGLPEVAWELGQPVIYLAHALEGDQRSEVTVAAVPLEEIFHPIRYYKIGLSGYAWVLDGQGRVIAISLSAPGKPSSPPAAEILEAKIGAGDLIRKAAVPGTDWTVVALLPHAEALAGPNRLRNLTLLIALVTILAGGAVAHLLATRISRPLVQLTDGVRRVSRGELATIDFAGGGREVDLLADAFNRMVADLRRTTVSRDYVDNLLNSMHDPLLVIAPDDSLETVNRSTGKILGYAPEELHQAPASLLLGAPPAEASSWWNALSANSPSSQEQMSLLARNGGEIPVTLSSAPLQGAKGGVEGIICVARDMTERKRMEGALRFIAEGVAAETGEGFFRALVDHLAEALQTHAALLAVAVTPTVGRALTFRVGDNYLDGLEYDQRTTPCGEVVRTCAPLFIPEKAQEIYPGLGKIGGVSYLGVPVRNAAGHVFGNLAIMDDKPMSEQPWKLSILQIFAVRAGAELERAENERRLQASAAALGRSNRELEEFAYVASHDLQEPLRKVSVFCDRLRSRYAEALDETGRDYLGRVLDATARMQNLIDDLLTYSRVTSRAQPFVPVDLAEVSRGVLADLEVRIEQLGAAVEITPLPTIEADPVQVRQLLQNLIGNALKFHRPGIPPTVRIAEVSGEDREACRLSVQDNGIGFDEKYSERIFAVFQRLHGRAEYEGSGVGLAVCRKIAERHGGRIEVHSTPGVGSNFEIILPVRQGKKEEA